LLRWKINLVVPIKSVNDELFGFIILGNKKSGSRFTTEDVDLLKDIGINAGSTIERIKLQEQLIREKLTAEKLEELNQQKSMFVSQVSHELKTPLTAIKMFSDLILEKEKYSYQKALSDISNSDVKCHSGEPEEIVFEVRNWFSELGCQNLVSGSTIWDDYNFFFTDFYEKLTKQGFREKDIDKMPIREFITYIETWLSDNNKKNHCA
jgi:hypothetical protein